MTLKELQCHFLSLQLKDLLTFSLGKILYQRTRIQKDADGLMVECFLEKNLQNPKTTKQLLKLLLKDILYKSWMNTFTEDRDCPSILSSELWNICFC